MPGDVRTGTAENHLVLRHRILEVLYDFFKEFPYAMVDIGDISEKCQTAPKELNWNLVYLEKCGFLELSKSTDSLPFIACSAVISASGIDLVENKEEFNHRFPFEGLSSP